VWKYLLLKWIFPTRKTNSKSGVQKLFTTTTKQTSRGQKDYTKHVPPRGPKNTKFSRKEDLVAGICATLEYFLSNCVCPQSTEFHETFYAYHNAEGASISSFIFQSSQQYPNDDRKKFWVQTDANTKQHTLSWNVARKVYKSVTTPYWRKCPRVALCLVANNIGLGNVKSATEGDHIPTWTQNWSHMLMSYKHGDRLKFKITF
jgi:hypothetical protein